MAISTKDLNNLIASGRFVAILGDAGEHVLVRFTARDRAYGEYQDMGCRDGKLHRDDITLVPMAELASTTRQFLEGMNRPVDEKASKMLLSQWDILAKGARA